MTPRPSADPVFAVADQFRLLIESVADYAIFMLDLRGFIVTWNPGAEHLKGYPSEEILGRHFSVFYPPEEVAAGTPARVLDRAAREGRYEGEGWRRRKDGSDFWAHLIVTPVRDDAGTLVGFAKVTRDLTERRRAELAREEQTRRLSSVLDCVVDAVSVYDTSGRLVLSNPAFDQMIGRAFATPASVDERARHYGLYSTDGQRRLTIDESPAFRAMRGEAVEDVELIVRSPASPDDIVVSTNAKCLRDAAGAVIGAVVSGRDVTARKQAERKLLEQKELLASILDCLGEAVVVYDPEGRILLTNRAASRAMMGSSTPAGSTLDERLPRNGFYSIDGARRLTREETALGRALQGEPSDDQELLVRSATQPDGTAFSSSGRPLVDEQGKLLGAVVTARDITVRRAVEKEKERLLRELTRSNEELAQFAHVASHDLRAPLRAIDSLAQWLEEDLRPHFTPETAEQMRLLQSRIRRMEALIGDLLAFARVGHSDADVGPIDLDALVRETIDLVAPPPTFRMVVDVAVHHLISAAVPLKRVLLNLLGNALKHHDRPEGEIKISVRDQGPFVELEVADDGPGIPPPFHHKVFEVFQTLKPRDTLEGSGMGLAFVKKIVEQAQGSVHLSSSGRGATFRIAWPKVWPSPRAGA
jgi:PAS domain S-box-containing protein